MKEWYSLPIQHLVSYLGQIYIQTITANVFQFLVSILYIQYNSLLSCMLVNREWYRYAAEKKPLRVSTPVGLQRSSYYVSMPFRYGIPLMSIMSLLHWMLSQGLFVLPLEPVNNDGTTDKASRISFLGFSLWPLFTGMLTFFTHSFTNIERRN
jgi:hypothetical protein